jgi:hypothetical protein
MQYTITLPDTFVVEVHGQQVITDMTKVSGQMITMAAMLGLGQKLRNGAASALFNAVQSAHDNATGDEKAKLALILKDDAVADRKAWGKLNPKALAQWSIAGVEAVRDNALYQNSWEQRGTAGLGLQVRNEIADLVALMHGIEAKKAEDRRAKAMEVFETLPQETKDKIREHAQEAIAEREAQAEAAAKAKAEAAAALKAMFKL